MISVSAREAIDLIAAYGEQKGWPVNTSDLLALSWFDVSDWIKPMITGDAEAAEWLGRIAPAVENDMMARRGK